MAHVHTGETYDSELTIYTYAVRISSEPEVVWRHRICFTKYNV